MVKEYLFSKATNGLVSPNTHRCVEVGIFRITKIIKGLVTPFLLFSHVSTVCSMIPQCKLVFSFVPVNSFVRTKDPPRDTVKTTGRYDLILISYLSTTSVLTLFYQSPQAWLSLTRAILVKYIQVTQGEASHQPIQCT